MALEAEQSRDDNAVTLFTRAEVVEGLLAALQPRLTASPDDPQLVRQWAELLRAAGALDQAATAFARLAHLTPDDRHALALAHLLRGRIDPILVAADIPAQNRPTPFLRRLNVVPDTVLAEIWHHLESGPAWHRSLIGGGRHRLNRCSPDFRNSQGLTDMAPLERLLRPHIQPLITDPALLSAFALDAQALDDGDMQLTRHGDGDHLSLHSDCGPGSPRRRLTYVYYFHRQPRGFQGGDLLMPDDDRAGSRMAVLRYTRLRPIHNSMVLFPSERPHEVTRVSCASPDPLDGRLAVHGWRSLVNPAD